MTGTVAEMGTVTVGMGWGGDGEKVVGMGWGWGQNILPCQSLICVTTVNTRIYAYCIL